MRHVAIIALTLSVLVFSAHARAADEMDESDKALVAKAVEFASHWFSLVMAGDYAAAYPATAANFQKEYPLEKWIDSEREFRITSGKPLEQGPAGLGAWERNPAGAAPGTYFLIYVFTKFENSDRCRTGIRVRLENDGSLHILGYDQDYVDKGSEKNMRELQQKYAGARFPTEKITKEEMEGYYKEISVLADWRRFPKDNTYVMRDAESDTSYIFTAPGHPAHPAVITLRQTVAQGISGVAKSGYFAGDGRHTGAGSPRLRRSGQLSARYWYWWMRFHQTP